MGRTWGARGTAKTASPSPTATPGRSSRAPTSTQRPTPPRPSAPRTSARGAGASTAGPSGWGASTEGVARAREREKGTERARPPAHPEKHPTILRGHTQLELHTVEVEALLIR